MKKILFPFMFTVLVSMISLTGNSQVLISLLLGDKLNTGNIEFGLDGGLNWLNMSNTPDAKLLPSWNLGFYFDFKLNNPHLFIHTGVLVKSNMGTSGLDPQNYMLNNNLLDSLFIGGSIDRKINYFNVPGMLRYRFDNFIHLEGGAQLGLRYTGYDFYKLKINEKDDLAFQNDVKDNYTRIDAGALAGVGYRFSKGKGLILALRYYHGFVDADRVREGNQYYSVIYLSGAIPIGRVKAERKAAEKAAEK